MDDSGGLGSEVSTTEAQVLSVLFEGNPGSDSERMRRSGLPQRTYLAAKKRLYGHGVVEDRYVPNPVAFGYRVATFVVARPFAEDLRTVSRVLTDNQKSVVVWSGGSVAFAVLLVSSQKSGPTSSLNNGPTPPPQKGGDL